jgi:hypothetical protein
MEGSEDGGASDSSELQKRVELVDTILKSPPHVHQGGAGVWSTERSCYEFMAGHVRPASRTLETGCGVSTVLFTAWGCKHLCVVPSEDQRDKLLEYCENLQIDASSLSFDLRSSDTALPDLAADLEFDLVFIDGSHGFPMPIIDWFYGAGRLRSGGIVVFDDIQLPQVSLLCDWFLDRDPRWTRLRATEKWVAYQRHSVGSLSEIQNTQPFLAKKGPEPESPMSHLARQVRSRLAALRSPSERKTR